MRIIVDADACPVIDTAISFSEKKGIECILVCDNTHSLNKENAVTITVDKGADCADIKIANTVLCDDIVITQDYGLAALCLAKGAAVLTQNGLIIDNKNIENLLYSRFMSKKARMAGMRTKGPKKRSREDDLNFEKALTALMEEK